MLMLAEHVLPVVCLLQPRLVQVESLESAFLNFLVNMSANVASADIVSSPMLAKGISGWGCFKAPLRSWAAISSRSVEDICGISEL
jgi:hypothetical protein